MPFRRGARAQGRMGRQLDEDPRSQHRRRHRRRVQPAKSCFKGKPIELKVAEIYVVGTNPITEYLVELVPVA